MSDDLTGTTLTLDVTAVAHGGHCVARHEGQVVFVRHTLPGERVLARVTEGHSDASFLRADAVEVLTPAPDRADPRCAVSGPGGCGGCDFQHVTLAGQRRLKADVVAEQLHRLAGLDVDIEVEPLPDVERDGLGWRTRMRWHRAASGAWGLRRHRSHDVVEVSDCPIAHPDLPVIGDADDGEATQVQAVVTSTGETALLSPDAAPMTVTEVVGERVLEVGAGDFWQVHPAAPATLVAAVTAAAEPQPGERCWDLYSGVGLFASALAESVGDGGSVVAVESDGPAVEHGRHNTAQLPQVRWERGRVDRWLRGRSGQGGVDVVVLDPPRTGAKAAVVKEIARRGPRVVVYVACDPAALARDVRTFADHGYRVSDLRAFDLFPMTHHVECVAVLRPEQT